MLIHYADVPHFNKECGLRGNMSKYLILNIDLISPEKNITHKRLKKQKVKHGSQLTLFTLSLQNSQLPNWEHSSTLLHLRTLEH